ncbi:hypothetical protein MTR67_012056 [Solanum verrucosum]|uniref:Uncharacterized protein n=1 Tax=Solanum verrucosum TaxID=315347 RepID=A0AAF0QDT0_SOLVR|nr:hypothetical protein MTR67_012056 [Solanum verrucosum]
MHRLARLGVQLVDSTKGGVMVHNGFELSFAMNVNSKQDLDPILVEFKESVLKKFVEAFFQGGDEALDLRLPNHGPWTHPRGVGPGRDSFLKPVSQGIEVDLKKTDVVKNWSIPLSPVVIQSFLGLAGYYRRWLEILKDYGLSILYHPGKANVVTDALSWLSMNIVAHIEDGGVTVHNGSKLSFVLDVKAKRGFDLLLVELKKMVLKMSVEAFSQGGDGVLRYQVCLRVLNFDDLKDQILSEAHSSRYSIHSGASKIYCDLREVYW